MDSVGVTTNSLRSCSAAILLTAPQRWTTFYQTLVWQTRFQRLLSLLFTAPLMECNEVLVRHGGFLEFLEPSKRCEGRKGTAFWHRVPICETIQFRSLFFRSGRQRTIVTSFSIRTQKYAIYSLWNALAKYFLQTENTQNVFSKTPFTGGDHSVES